MRPLAAIAAALVLALAGCGDDGSDGDTTSREEQLRIEAEQRKAEIANQRQRLREQRAREEAEQEEAGASSDPPLSGGLLSEADVASFERLERRLGGESGIAVSSLGVGRRVLEAGTLRSGVAWSTIKVAIAAAVIDAGLPAGHPQLRRAITASDNAAAEQLWARLGGGAEAGVAVEEQLGDDTVVQTRRVRAGFTPFGQTEWPLRAQTRYVAGLACTPEGARVLGLMSDVVASQRWGLGRTGHRAELKGGWGPAPDGDYLVRQTGVITLRGRPIAVSLMTEPADGTFPGGTRNATAIARWAAGHIDPTAAPRRPRC
jgi:hypothetical protein